MNFKTSLKLTFALLVFRTANSQTFEFSTNERQVLGNLKEKTASIDAGDIDNDGDIDLVVANGRHWPGQNRIFLNNGDGLFTISKALGNQRDTSYSTELADFDNDGDLDVAVGNDRAPNRIYFNDGNGSGSFESTIGFGSKKDSTIDVEVSDMNKDGNKDLILANRDGQQNYVYINDGNLNFVTKIPFGSGKDNTRSVEIEDLNQDGINDIVTANIGQANVIYFGSSEGTFNDSVKYDLDLDHSYSISVGDLDLDGDADIVVGNAREVNTIFINFGAGRSWEKASLANKKFLTYDILINDLNADGKPEIIESNSDEKNFYYINRTNK